VPKDKRIVIAKTYEGVPDDVYAARLHACDLLAFPIVPTSDLLTSGVPSDAISVGIGGLASNWTYVREYMRDAAIPAGHTQSSVTACLDALTEEDVSKAKAAAVALQHERSFRRSAQVFYSALSAKSVGGAFARSNTTDNQTGSRLNV